MSDKDPNNGTVPYFQFRRRNFGHWDVWDKDRRIFAIRGGPGRYYIRDGRRDENGNWRCGPGTTYFKAKSLGLCFQHICEELTFELIIAEGQDFEVIEAWNV